MKCPRCDRRMPGVPEGDDEGYAFDVCAPCQEELELHADDDPCIRDDSTECDCSRCTAANDAFWRDQGGES